MGPGAALGLGVLALVSVGLIAYGSLPPPPPPLAPLAVWCACGPQASGSVRTWPAAQPLVPLAGTMAMSPHPSHLPSTCGARAQAGCGVLFRSVEALFQSRICHPAEPRICLLFRSLGSSTQNPPHFLALTPDPPHRYEVSTCPDARLAAVTGGAAAALVTPQGCGEDTARGHEGIRCVVPPPPSTPQPAPPHLFLYIHA